MPFLLVIAALIGIACNKEAEKFQRQNGTAPWGASPMLWGIIGFLIGIFGALLLFIAERTTDKKAQSNVVWSQSPYADPRFAAPPAQQWAPPPGPWSPAAAPAPAPAPVAPPAQWGAPPPPAAPQPAPPAPNVGGSDFLPRR